MNKKKRDILIPDLKGITIVQSNRVTNAKYDYTLIQERVFTWVMYYLQNEINQVMNGTRVTQLNIFRDLPSDMLSMTIPMHHLGRPDQYRDIRSAIEKMSGVKIVIRTVDKSMIKWAGLFSSVEMPNKEDNRRSAYVTIEIRRDVAQMLVDVQYNTNVPGKRDGPEQFTKYMLNVALEAKFKYTSKVYKLLCSYKERRYYMCTIDELREHLQIPAGVYKNYNDFKRFILDPVAAELKSIADIFFDTSDPEFTQRAGRKVTGLKFNLLYPVTEALYDRTKTKFIRDLIKIFGCQERHINQVLPYLHPETNWNKLENIVDRCYYLCSKRMVDHPAAFVVRSIINEFAPV